MKIGDCVHAKPKLHFMKQNVLYIFEETVKNFFMRDLITGKNYRFPKDVVSNFFEKTNSHVPAQHPNTDIFR